MALAQNSRTFLVKNIFAIYRLTHGVKISSFRLLGYAVFGFLVSGIFDARLYVLDLLTLFFLLMSASFFNDYYDWKLLGEENAVSKYNIQSVVWGIMPLCFSGIFFFLLLHIGITYSSAVLLGYVLVASVVYSVPPVRFKERKIFNIVVPALGIFFMFLQGVLLLHPLDSWGMWITIIVGLFVLYLELLHYVDDSFHTHEIQRTTRLQAVKGLKLVSYAGMVVAFFASFWHPIFLVSCVAWFLRLRAVMYTQPEKYAKARRSIFSPLWHLEDFLIYGVGGFIRMFS